MAYESILQSGRCPDSRIQIIYFVIYTKLTLKIYIYQPILSSRPFRTYFLYKIFYNKKEVKFSLILHLHVPGIFTFYTFSLYFLFVGAVDCSSYIRRRRSSEENENSHVNAFVMIHIFLFVSYM